MIPPPPPPNSNKIQIFTKSLNAITKPTKNKLKSSFRSVSPPIINKSLRPGKSFDLHINSSKKEATPGMQLLKNKSMDLVFDEELKQKLETKKKLSNAIHSSIDESALLNRNNNTGGANCLEVETELEAILKKRREKTSSTPPITRKTTPLFHEEFPRKSASFRVNLGETKFSTLPSKRTKPKIPDKKPSFARGDSFKIQSWNRISSGNKCI